MTDRTLTAPRPRARPAEPPLRSDPVHDADRLAALRALGLLDGPASPAFDRLTRLAAKVVRAPVALVSLVDDDRQFFASSRGLCEPWASCRQTPLSHSFCQHVVRSGDPLVIPDARRDPLVRGNRAIPELGVSAYLGMPLTTAAGHVLGSLCVIDDRPRDWDEDEVETLRDLAAAVMTEIGLREQLRVAQSLNEELEDQRAALARANEQLAEAAMTDGLTGLKNRRHFAEALDAAHALAVRGASPLSIVLVDVDEFKSYNDAHGHPAGDDVLRAVAEALRSSTRNSDVVARYGGEEFALLLPGICPSGAVEAAERLRLAIESRPWPLRAVTASFGASTLIEGDTGPWALVEQADRALYHSKRSGRNRVTHHHTVPGAAPDR